MILTAERIWFDGALRSGWGVAIDQQGRIERVAPLREMEAPDHNLGPRIVLPGFVNAHSHAFQRLLRGRTQTAGSGDDNFWTWRQAMYAVAQHLDPARMLVAARQAFIEMLLAGVTCVGEFHYVHHQPDGTPYRDSVAMADAIAQAALEVGIRLCLLRVIYLRGDFNKPPNEHQRRFVDKSLDAAMAQVELTMHRLRSYVDPRIAWGIAAHSLRAVPIEAVVAVKTTAGHLPFHIHVSEQRREVDGCLRTHGLPPIELLGQHGALDAGTTLVHATHLRAGEADLIGYSGAGVCVCPTTEADLGDGLVPAAHLYRSGASLSLGTDGQTFSSVLEEARRLEMHERLRVEERNLLAPGPHRSVAPTLLQAATRGGARALDLPCGEIAPGRWADLVAFDLNDPHLAGGDDASWLEQIIFSSDTRAVREVMVGGKWVVQEGEHKLSAVSAHSFGKLSREIFA